MLIELTVINNYIKYSFYSINLILSGVSIDSLLLSPYMITEQLVITNTQKELPLLSFYHQQILLHSNDSLYLYLLVGITRLIQILTPLSIPPSYSSTISFFISSILSPFLLCIEPHLQAKTRSHRRTDTSITYDTLKQLSLSTTTIDSIPSEQTLTILTCGFSLLSYFHSRPHIPPFALFVLPILMRVTVDKIQYQSHGFESQITIIITT